MATLSRQTRLRAKRLPQPLPPRALPSPSAPLVQARVTECRSAGDGPLLRLQLQGHCFHRIARQSYLGTTATMGKVMALVRRRLLAAAARRRSQQRRPPPLRLTARRQARRWFVDGLVGAPSQQQQRRRPLLPRPWALEAAALGLLASQPQENGGVMLATATMTPTWLSVALLQLPLPVLLPLACWPRALAQSSRR